MADRRLVCAACSDPSPGPIRRLYYQKRKHGPFFPILATLKHSGNVSLFSGGRVAVCMGCSSHLQRQWMAYEKSWTPLEKRSYKLLAGILVNSGIKFSLTAGTISRIIARWNS